MWIDGSRVPIDKWLEGPLRDWVESLLSERALADTGFLDPRPIRNAWARHLTHQGNQHYQLWIILMLQL